jgi:hypothetical protein
MANASNSHPLHNPATRAHYSRTMRRNMVKMAAAMGIDPTKYGDDYDALWSKMTETLHGGIESPTETVIGDPFAFFLTRSCANPDCKAEHTFVIKSPNGGPIDQAEAEKMRDYLLGQPDVNECPECHWKLTNYSSQMTRLSVFETDKAK